MHYTNIKTRRLKGYSAALLFGLSLPVLVNCGGNHDDESHRDIAGESADRHRHSEADDNGGNAAHQSADHHNSNMVADTVMATVVHVDAGNRQLALDHEALPTIGMEAMAMAFTLDDGVSIADIKKGDRVTITVAMKPGKGLVITEVSAAQ